MRQNYNVLDIFTFWSEQAAANLDLVAMRKHDAPDLSDSEIRGR